MSESSSTISRCLSFLALTVCSTDGFCLLPKRISEMFDRVFYTKLKSISASHLKRKIYSCGVFLAGGQSGWRITREDKVTTEAYFQYGDLNRIIHEESPA